VAGFDAKNAGVLKGRWKPAMFFHRPFKTVFILDCEPGTMCRANFLLPLRGDVFPAPGVLQRIAHGETVGNRVEREPAPDGAKELFQTSEVFLPPLPGL
jgi:hypothetical protein